MEGESTPENSENVEERIAQMLRERGLEDLETKELFYNWTREQEKLVDQAEDRVLGQIQLNLRRARLCFAGGCFNEAIDNYYDAKSYARNGNRDELYEAIKQEMDEKEKFLMELASGVEEKK